MLLSWCFHTRLRNTLEATQAILGSSANRRTDGTTPIHHPTGVSTHDTKLVRLNAREAGRHRDVRLVGVPLEKVVESLAVHLWVHARNLSAVVCKRFEERLSVLPCVVLL